MHPSGETEAQFRIHVTEVICLACAGLGCIATVYPWLVTGRFSLSNTGFTLLAVLGYYLAKYRQAYRPVAYCLVALLLLTGIAFDYYHGIYGALAYLLMTFAVIVAGLLLSPWLAVLSFFVQLALMVPLSRMQEQQHALLAQHANLTVDSVAALGVAVLILLVIQLYTRQIYRLNSQHLIYQNQLTTYVRDFDHAVATRSEDVKRQVEESIAKLEEEARLGRELSHLTHDIGNSLANLRLIFDHYAKHLDENDRKETDEYFTGLTKLIRTAQNYRSAQKKSTPITAATSNCLSLLGKILRQEEIQVETELEEASVALSNDVLQRVIFNLLMNSVDALKNEKKKRRLIRITGQVVGTTYRLNVADNGCGIPSDILPLLPQKWLTTKPGHSGSGLAAVQEILAATGGGIELASRHRKGTSVTASCPVTSA